MQELSKVYNKTAAVDHVSLSVEDGKILALLGPSGCGKTTLLRMVAGLIPTTGGKLFFDGNDVTDLPAQKRNTAMVFQNYALFPNMNVFDNVAFGLKIRNIPKNERRRKVMDILACVELSGLEYRPIQELSGGQRQRVALARALVIEPDILLFDEPLSNLDQKLRVSMRQTIKELQRKFGITSIYVTHDQEEAMAIADEIAVMNRGKLQQVDSPQNLYFKPQNAFVADFIGKANLFTADVSEQDGTVYADLLGKRIPLSAPSSSGSAVSAMLRPENLFFSKDGIPGTVSSVEVLGLITRYHIMVGDKSVLLDQLSNQKERPYKEGDTVFVDFHTGDLHIWLH